MVRDGDLVMYTKETHSIIQHTSLAQLALPGRYSFLPVDVRLYFFIAQTGVPTAYSKQHLQIHGMELLTPALWPLRYPKPISISTWELGLETVWYEVDDVGRNFCVGWKRHSPSSEILLLCILIPSRAYHETFAGCCTSSSPCMFDFIKYFANAFITLTHWSQKQNILISLSTNRWCLAIWKHCYCRS